MDSDYDYCSNSSTEDDEYDYCSSSSDHVEEEDDDSDLPSELDYDIDEPVARNSSIKVISKESLLADERKALCRVMELLSVKEHHSRTLLIRYHWDIELLFAVLEDKGKALLFEEAGLPELDSQDLGLPLLSSMMACGKCTLDIPTSMMTKMDCGHCFCNNCWREHFIVQISEGQSRRIRCMAHECSTIVDEAIARHLVHEGHPDLADKFDRFLLESYIDENKMVKWCPSVPHCGNAISVKGDELCEVECSCGKQFCFNCLSEAHSPCSCAMWALWKKDRDELQRTYSWIIENTTSCPNCHELVESNGHGNSVTCPCGQLFCWSCGCRVGQHSRHVCPTAVEKKEHVYYRYMNYHNRYNAHTDSINQESTIKRSVLDKMEVLANISCDFLWVKDGLYKLFQLRRTLSNLYPFAFCMFGDNSILLEDGITKEELETKQRIFEFQQRQLEEYVQKLSNLLEEPFHLYNEERIAEIKHEVSNLSSMGDRFCKQLYEHIETELLGSHQCNNHSIVPYSTKGVEKAMSNCNIVSS